MRRILKVLFVSILMFNYLNGMEDKKQDLIILAAPTIEDTYDDRKSLELFYDIVDFHIGYINAIYGKDKVYIIVDRKTRKYFEGQVPDEVLITSESLHIWMRDFTTINPFKPVQFRYSPVTFEDDQRTADEIQNEFNQFLQTLGIKYSKVYFEDYHLMLDGGNIVDDYNGKVITTTRFLEDNELTKKEGILILKKALNASRVAIIESDEPVMAHSDGMVMFTDENTLFVNQYDEPLRTRVLSELKRAFPSVKIIEIEAKYDQEDEFSACGINLNATVTSKYIYMPHFGDFHSDKIQAQIQKHTSKKVIAVPANGVCKLGGSVRCLSWQQSGENAKKIIDALEKR